MTCPTFPDIRHPARDSLERCKVPNMASEPPLSRDGGGRTSVGARHSKGARAKGCNIETGCQFTALVKHHLWQLKDYTSEYGLGIYKACQNPKVKALGKEMKMGQRRGKSSLTSS